MNDEIKEILDKLKEEIDLKPLWYSERMKLLDYITNLQQDNTMYAQLKDEYEEEIKDLQQENDDLKNRLENAIADCNLRLQENERLKEWKEDLLKENIELENTRKEAIEYINEHPVDSCHYLLNILQNGSDEE